MHGPTEEKLLYETGKVAAGSLKVERQESRPTRLILGLMDQEGRTRGETSIKYFTSWASEVKDTWACQGSSSAVIPLLALDEYLSGEMNKI